jgi:hypothetical protein
MLWIASLYIIVFIIILIILFLNKPTKILNVHESAEEATRFATTFFLIYDKSLPDALDRLVVVEPFGWIIWAINNDIYILENTSAIQCQLGSSPAIKVTENIFSMVSICINIEPTALLNLYDDPVRVNYDVLDSSSPNRFTVLDALNILFREHLTVKFTNDTPDDATHKISTFNRQIAKSLSPLPAKAFNLNKFSVYNDDTLQELFERVYSRKFDKNIDASMKSSNSLSVDV